MRVRYSELIIPLLLLVLINLLPGIFFRPAWAISLAFALVAVRAWLHFSLARPVPRWWSWLLVAITGLLVWQHYFSFMGDEAAGTLLMLVMCVKTFELNHKRDFFLTAILAFLVLMSFLISNQSLSLTLFMAVDALLIFGFLKALEKEEWDWKASRALFQSSLFLALKSLPLTFVIFVLFPRFSTGFGSSAKASAKTGITDELRPGTVAQLIQSDELVFRATFAKNEMPPHQELYWRAAVLDQGAGLNWGRSANTSLESVPVGFAGQGQVEIYLEPGFEKFLFALENTQTLYFPNDTNVSRVLRRQGGTFELQRPLQVRDRYFLRLATDDLAVVQEAEKLDRFLRMGEKPSPQLRSLLKEVEGRSARDTVTLLTRYFQQNGYQYSLQPPPAESLDEFLFKSKSGFCEHYAGAMTTMLRLLKIPARVVVGFQGGTPSLLGDYVTVRGHDAHAWVEYFDANQKLWTRIDPTAHVAPARISQGSELYLDSQSQGIFNGELAKYWRRTQWIFDEVEARWIGFLIRFDLAQQKELLAKLGMEEVLIRALLVFLTMALMLAFAVLYFIEAQRSEKLPEAEKLYLLFLRAMRRHGFKKAPHEGPMALMQRLESENPQLAEKARPVLETLVSARFSLAKSTPEEWKELRKSIRSLRRLRLSTQRH